jgi:hypothetical protein
LKTKNLMPVSTTDALRLNFSATQINHPKKECTMFFVPIIRNDSDQTRAWKRLFDEGLVDRFFTPVRSQASECSP